MSQYSLYRPGAGTPWVSLGQLQRELNSLFDRPTWSSATLGGLRGVFPPVNFFETTDAYVLTAELAGVASEDINVSIEGTTITLEGERKIDFGDFDDAKMHRRERQAGKFRRAFTLPAKVDAEKVEAIHRNGVLMVRVPKSPEAQPRQIAVQVEQS